MSKTIDNIIYSDDLKTVEKAENDEISTAIIKEGVTTIRSWAFNKCTNLQNVTIPEGVTTIGKSTFYYCENLQNVAIPEGVIEIGESAFFFCKNLQSVVIPEGVTEIGGGAFASCEKLQNVDIPDSVTEIGEKAFSSCKIENYEHKLFKIKNGCFLSSDGKTVLYCSNDSKQEIVIPEGVTTIGEAAFAYRENLQNVVIPEGVTEIGFRAFDWCTNLQSVVIPASVTEIGEYAFDRCKNLQEVKYLGTAKEWGKVKFAKSKEKAEIRKLIKKFVLQDAKDAKIKEIQTVGAEGIMNAMKETYPSLNFQVLNTTKTNQALFVMGGKNATVIQLSLNVSSWEEKVQSFLSVFCDETKTNEEIEEAFTTYKIKIAEIKKTFSKPQIEADEMNLFIDELPEMKSEDHDYTSHSFFYKAKIKKLTFARNTLIDWRTFTQNKSFECIILPESVTSIGCEAFYYCKNLQNVVIPEGVTEIGVEAFSYCENLQNVVIPKGVTEIGFRAFDSCKNLQNVVVPEGVTTIGDQAFEYCKNLQNVDIPDSVTEIGGRAFKYCKIENYEHKLFKVKDGCYLSKDEKTVLYCANDSKQEIVIPKGVTEIGFRAFDSCKNLQNVVIPKGVTTIGEEAFSWCENLQNVVIPEGVTTIGGEAFYCCENLQNVVIPEGVTTIGEWAFRGCKNLTVTFDGTKEEWEKIEGVKGFKGCEAENVKFNK